MPYIKPQNRDKYNQFIELTKIMLGESESQLGDLNYIISKIIWGLWEANPNYTNANNLIGVLECAKQEFYRRKVAPMEDIKIKENGDLK